MSRPIRPRPIGNHLALLFCGLVLIAIAVRLLAVGGAS